MADPVLFVRADSDARIGSGHLVRSVALAQAWQERAGRAVVVTSADPATLPAGIAATGLELVQIPFAHPHTDDLDRVRKLSAFHPGSAVACDGYHFDATYTRGLQDAGLRVAVIDDIAHAPWYAADVIVNQNVHAERLAYPVEPTTRLLLGPKYALLRRDFARWSGWNPPVADRARHILVTMGGADPMNQTGRVMRAAGVLDDPELEVKVIVGNTNTHGPVLEAIARENRAVRFELLRNPPDIAALLAWADVAVAAGGSTCWELCFMGVPSLLITLVDNQAGITYGLAEEGAAVHVGWFNEIDEAKIAATLGAILADPARRATLRERARTLVDGAGAERVVRALCDDAAAAVAR